MEVLNRATAAAVYIPRQLRRKVVLNEVCMVRRGSPGFLANQIDLSHAFATFPITCQNRQPRCYRLDGATWIQLSLTLSDRIKTSKAMQTVNDLELKCRRGDLPIAPRNIWTAWTEGA